MYVEQKCLSTVDATRRHAERCNNWLNFADRAAHGARASLPIYSFDAPIPLKPRKDGYICKGHDQSGQHGDPERRIEAANCDENRHAAGDDRRKEPLELENRSKLAAFFAVTAIN